MSPRGGQRGTALGGPPHDIGNSLRDHLSPAAAEGLVAAQLSPRFAISFAATVATPPRNETRSCDYGHDHEPGGDLNSKDLNHRSLPGSDRPE